MKEHLEQPSPATASSLERVPGYLSVREAARIIGVSERSVYGYVEAGKLPGARIGNIIVVSAPHVYAFERRAPGRVRTTTPRWRIPPTKNPQYLTIITVRLRPGQGDLLDCKLEEIRRAGTHRFPGTAARSIGRGQEDPDEVTITLVWRGVVMPAKEERAAALAAFAAELAEVLDWETAVSAEDQVLLHA